MTAPTPRADPLSVECPSCLSAPGRSCLNAFGLPVPHRIHGLRRQLARRIAMVVEAIDITVVEEELP